MKEYGFGMLKHTLAWLRGADSQWNVNLGDDSVGPYYNSLSIVSLYVGRKRACNSG